MDVDDRLVRKLLEGMINRLVPPVREALAEVLQSIPDPDDAALLLEDRNAWVLAYGHASAILKRVAILLAKQEEGLMTPDQCVEAIKAVLADPPDQESPQ